MVGVRKREIEGTGFQILFRELFYQIKVWNNLCLVRRKLWKEYMKQC